MKNWYVVQCKPNQDARAQENLNNQAFETFRPLARVRRRCRGQLKSAIESLFPRYLFIHLDEQEEDWGPIRSTRGVANLV
ncbi:MAG: transcriptional activator RfaH, partial [Pseudomonadales bacterium]|nr:transcriptional activator RfaH [Pseudomonadales bacterium]